MSHALIPPAHVGISLPAQVSIPRDVFSRMFFACTALETMTQMIDELRTAKPGRELEDARTRAGALLQHIEREKQAGN